MSLTEILLNETSEIWKAYNNHPFVLGIENGTLAKDKFRYYIIQDFLYLKDYAKTFAMGIAKSKSLETANLFSKYLALMNGELDIHKGYNAKMGISISEIENTRQSLNNLSYTSYMLRVAYEYGESEILAAILPCACSYESIAKKIVKNNPNSIKDAFYGDWIRGYSSESYTAGNAELLNLMNFLTVNYNEKSLERLKEIFTVCSQYELSFWQMSWDMS